MNRLSCPVAAMVAVVLTPYRLRGEETRDQLRKVIEERDQLQRELEATRSQSNELQKEFEAYKQKAVVSDEHVMFEEAKRLEEAVKVGEAGVMYAKFKIHYPESKMYSIADAKVSEIQKVLESQVRAEPGSRSCETGCMPCAHAPSGSRS